MITPDSLENRDKDSLIHEIVFLSSLLDSKDSTISDLRSMNSFLKDIIDSFISSKSI